MSTPFAEFMKKHTKPFPDHACPTCGTWALRRYEEPGEQERVICTNRDCPTFEQVPGMPA